MRIYKDNYKERDINRKIRTLITIGLAFCSILLLATVIFALASTSAAYALPAGLMVALAVGGKKLAMLGIAGVTITRSNIVATGTHKQDTIPLKDSTFTENILMGQPITQGSAVNYGGATPFPGGQGWYTLYLDFYLNLIIGSGATALSEGELLCIKDIELKDDKHGLLVKACGRALYRRAHRQFKTAPNKDAIGASTAVYHVQIPIAFANPELRRPEDTLLDMDGMTNFDCTITFGGIADLLGTPGTATLSVTMDATIERTKKKVDAGNAPKFQPYIVQPQGIDPTVNQYIEIEKTKELGILGIYLYTGNSVSPGVPFSGTPTANVIKRLSFQDNAVYPYNGVTVPTFAGISKLKQQAETMPTGWLWIWLAQDGSVWSAFPAGKKSKLQVNWINDTPSTSAVWLLIEGVKAATQEAA